MAEFCFESYYIPYLNY